MQIKTSDTDTMKKAVYDIAVDKELKFDGVERRFNIATISCSEGPMTDEEFEHWMHEVSKIKPAPPYKVAFYDDVSGKRILVS